MNKERRINLKNSKDHDTYNFRLEYLNLLVEKFLLDTPITNYTFYQGRVIGNTLDATKKFIDFLGEVSPFGYTGEEVASVFSLKAIEEEDLDVYASVPTEPVEDVVINHDHEGKYSDTLASLKEVAVPVHNWLRKNGHTYTQIIINSWGISLTEDLIGIPVPLDEEDI